MRQFAPPEAVVLLLLESSDHPMHLGMLEMFRPPEGAEADFARGIYETIRAFRDADPAYAGHPAKTRRGTSRLRWTYDDHVDIDYHVRYTSLPTPGGRNELFGWSTTCTAGCSIAIGRCGNAT